MNARRPLLSPPVLVLKITSELAARSEIIHGTTGLPAGSFVRLSVGSTRPPLWLVDHIRDDLIFQVEARSVASLTAWQEALGGKL